MGLGVGEHLERDRPTGLRVLPNLGYERKSKKSPLVHDSGNRVVRRVRGGGTYEPRKTGLNPGILRRGVNGRSKRI